MSSKLLPFLLLLFLPSIVTSLDAFNDDVLGLIVFKAGLSDPLGKLSSWNENDDTPCKWNAIQCDPNTNRVIGLTLDGFSLSGQISRGLLRLQSLQRLNLSNNNLSGPINPDFGQLWGLESIDLSNNNLTGTIPDELFQQCGTLKYVNFGNNKLSGTMPESLGSCMSLLYLNMSFNQISGQLDSKIWSLSGLQSLDVSNNLLEGVLPSGFGSMYSLRVVSLGNNALSGTLPDDIGSCWQLQTVDFGGNLFSGVIPESLQRLNMCTTVNLHGNMLNGEVPDWIGHLGSLERLDLSGNKFFGRIPFTVGNLRSLKELNLSSNGLIGGLPESLMNCGNLLSVDVSHNMLKGKFPNWVFGLELIQRVSLNGNKFKGNIEFPSPRLNSPSYQSLEFLDLSSNQLSGVIPSEIGEFRSLQVLNLSGNSLNGWIPRNVGELKDGIQVIDLSDNMLNGSIPAEIGQCSSMTTLILSGNNLTGTIPPALANLTNLEVVDLSHNKLSGNLPKDLTDLSHLTLFNVSNNHLEGELPAGGFFDTITLSSVQGNPSLCGSVVNQSCPAVHPKPIVLNPNPGSSSDSGDGDDDGSAFPTNARHKKRLILSISALIAIGAAAFILLGVVVITILNVHVRNARGANHSWPPPPTFSGGGDHDEECKYNQCSPTSDSSQYGKLVMFSGGGEADFGPAGAQPLLNKGSELGRGGFGSVYRAALADGRSVVAIKKLSISGLIKSQHEFEKEVKKLGKVRHPNLVSLQGYYWAPSLQLLINEYVPNGSLFNLLHDEKETVSWHERFNIIVGLARGLAHLHQMNVIHYNLKSSNVLLDSTGEPKVGDFGLARLLPMLDRYVLSSKIQSALGYMAPEFACKTVKITEKCDVYGFGILVLEIVTGRKPVEYMEDDVIVLCDMVRGALEEGKAEDIVDRRLDGNFIAEEVIPVIKLGLICASQVPSNRPDMAEVVNILELIQCPSEGREEMVE